MPRQPLPDDSDPPTVNDAIRARLRVLGWCNSCDHSHTINLGALVRRGHGETQLIRLKLKCSECGSSNCRAIVNGTPYR